MKKWEMNLGSECERSECKRSEGESSPECVMVWYRRQWAYRWQRWAYRREWLSALLRMVLLEPSRMVRNDWVWVWVRTVGNGVAEAVANGSRQLGLGLGSDRHEWCCRGRRGWFVMIGFEFGFGSLQMLLPDRGKWFCWTVANGCRRRFGSFRRWWGSTAIGFRSEARRRLGLGFRGSIGFSFQKNHN